MKRPILLSVVFCSLLNPNLSRADRMNGNLQFGFIENKGQVVDQNHKLNKEVNYLLNNKGLNVQLRKGGFSYDAYVIEDNNAAARLWTLNASNRDVVGITYKFHRVDITLEGSNSNAKIITGEANADYINYYTTGAQAVNVHHFNTVTYKDIYPGIDLEFTTQPTGGTVEYNFIVHPGANPDQIRMHYEGMNNIALTNNRLNLSVAHGNIQEKIPESYTASTHSRVTVNYKLQAPNTYGFNIGAYDKTQTLIIDPKPDIAWATYYGGSALDAGNSVASSNNSVFLAGSTLSSTGIATTGAHQTTISSLSDCFIASFSNAGARNWATYYGNTGQDIAYGIAATGGGDIAITGETNSASGFATSSAHQTTINGTGSDAFIAKFNNSGTIQWCTYYGEIDVEIGYSVALDASGNIFMSGTTGSPSNIAGTIGSTSPAQTMMGGLLDAFLVKFNSSGAFQWGTYAGEMMKEEGYGVAVDQSGNVFLAGVVYNGMGGDLVTSGAHQTTYGGDTTDYFLEKYNGSDGTRQWGTYYGGSGGEFAERGNKIACDGSNIYLVGSTYSTTGIATTGTGVYQSAFANGLNDGFIAKFNGSGVRQWATYYGATTDESIIAVSANAAGDVFALGVTNSLGGLSTPDAAQLSSGGGTDGFIVGFDNTGARLWATYLGGNVDDYVNGIAVNSANNLFIAGNTASSNGLATTGAHQASNGGGGDAFLARLNACKTSNITATRNITSAGCFGQTNGIIDVVNVLGGTSPYKFKLNTGTFQTSGTFSNLATGGYDVIIKDDNSCEKTYHDTVTGYAQIQLPITINGPTTAQSFYEQNYSIATPQTGITYTWSVTTGNGSIQSGNGTDAVKVLWGHVGTGTLKVVASSGPGCEEPVTYQVNITPSSVNDINAGNVAIYPNPATGQLNIELQHVPEAGTQLKLYDSFGRLILARELKQTQKIDLSNLASGVYNLNIGEWNTKVSKL